MSKLARTIAEARQSLFDALDVPTVKVVGVVTKVFDYEPNPVETAKPGIVTIFATGVAPDEWLFSIRVYLMGEYGNEAAQKTMDTLVGAVDDALDAANIVSVGPSQWTIGWADNLAALVAQSDVVIGREDF